MHRWALALTLLGGCYLSHDGEEDLEPARCDPLCVGDPGDLVHFQTVPGGRAPIHWETAHGCIAVSHSPDLPAEQQLNFAANVDMFGAVDCSRLCLAFPVADDAPTFLSTPATPADRRVHIGLAPGLGMTSLVTIFHDPCNGAIQYASIEIDPEVAEDVSFEDLTRMVARSVGLFRAEREADSALTGVGRVTDADVQALCAMYGERPYCAD